jgi:hypothetical protein
MAMIARRDAAAHDRAILGRSPAFGSHPNSPQRAGRTCGGRQPVIRRGCTNVICDGDEGGPAVRFSPSMAAPSLI